MMDPRQPPPILSRPPSYTEPRPWQTTAPVMAVSMPFPILVFGLSQFPGGINTTMEASTAVFRVALPVLSVPVLVTLALAILYLWRRYRNKGKSATSPNALITSISVVFFWVCALGWQSHKDAVFQRNLEARLQPWAESILSRPRSVDLDSYYIREDVVPAFVGGGHMQLQTARGSTFGANEDSIVIFYGFHQSVGGYVVGRKTLRIKEGVRRARKLKDGLYRFRDKDWFQGKE